MLNLLPLLPVLLLSLPHLFFLFLVLLPFLSLILLLFQLALLLPPRLLPFVFSPCLCLYSLILLSFIVLLAMAFIGILALFLFLLKLGGIVFGVSDAIKIVVVNAVLHLLHEVVDFESDLLDPLGDFCGDSGCLTANGLHVLEALLPVEEVDDAHALVDFFEVGVAVEHEVVDAVELLAAEGLHDCLHLQQDAIFQFPHILLEDAVQLLPLGNNIAYPLLEVGVVAAAALVVAVHAESVERSDQFVDPAHPVLAVQFGHAPLAELPVERAVLLQADVLDSLVFVRIKPAAHAYTALFAFLGELSGKLGIEEHHWTFRERMKSAYSSAFEPNAYESICKQKEFFLPLPYLHSLQQQHILLQSK